MEEVRKRAIRFLVSKIPQLDSTVFTKDTEEFLIKQIKQVIKPVQPSDWRLCNTTRKKNIFLTLFVLKDEKGPSLPFSKGR